MGFIGIERVQLNCVIQGIKDRNCLNWSKTSKTGQQGIKRYEGRKDRKESKGS